ncbi:uncharacterized protein LOC110039444 isoform X1 [Phalaenopsis equestris]|uniref:uncharacterized protein LOC110039444 isoform X1 n=1 Tax=Phalaenopsis equestris TaxID=78828 RepID=UPI0009E2CF60|nr:uncharacterized protein LOC110039444 isoform X1 [Phalaenopsis equestris]
MDADKIPIVIPFVHSGRQEIMPIGSNFPKVGKKIALYYIYLQVTVVVGDPIQLEDMIVDDTEEVSRGILYDPVSSKISHRLRELKILADKLASEHTIDLRYYFTHKAQGGMHSGSEWIGMH